MLIGARRTLLRRPPIVGLVSATAIWNAADAAASLTLTSGNLDLFSTSGTKGSARATHSQTTGRFYFEFTTPHLTSAFNLAVGIANSSYNVTTDTAGQAVTSCMFYPADGEVFISNVAIGTSGAITTTGGTYAAVAVDLAAKQMWIGSSSYSTAFWNNIAGGNPATGGGALDISSMSFTGGVFPAVFISNVTQTNAEVLANFGATAYSYASTFTTLQAAGYANW